MRTTLLARAVLISLVALATPPARAAAPAAPEARDLLNAERFPEAERAFKAYLDANPYDGRVWMDYGFTLHPQKRYDEAIAAWRRAIELGVNPAGNHYNIACAQSLAGRADEAIEAIRAALELGFTEDEAFKTDTDLDPIRADPRFRAVVGCYPPEGLSRDDQWRYDLDFFSRRMRQMHYRLFAKISEADFDAEVAAIKRDIPSLDDDAVAFRIRRLLARVGDGHTTLSRLKPGQTTVPRLPLELCLFSDGLFVRSAAPDLERIVGARVERIGDLTGAQSIDAMKAYTSVDNAMGYKDQSVSYLSVPAALVAIGGARDTAGASFTLTLRSGASETVTVAPTPVNPQDFKPWGIEGYARANAGAGAPVPLYLQRPADNLWCEALPDDRALYVCFRAVADPSDQSFADFWEGVFHRIDSESIDRLIIDMRHNGGGNTGLVRPFLHALIRADRVNKPGSLFVIIGRRTFSAAMNTVSLIEAHTNVTFVGEPTGSSPNFVGESTSFILPCNNLRVYCSSRYWQHVVSLDKRTWIPPHIAADLSSADFAANRDPAMDAILRAIRTPAAPASGAAAN